MLAERPAPHAIERPDSDVYLLLTALLKRRTRRFGQGRRLNGGPLAYQSVETPVPLTREEEAALAIAAVGFTGRIFGDLPYDSGDQFEAGCGNILAQFAGRTAISADALHVVALFVINDDGTWLIRRPQDCSLDEQLAIVDLARSGRLVEAYERLRIRVSDQRIDVPREVPFVHPFNKWNANLPGSTFFLPVSELTGAYINGLLYALSEEFAAYPVDERRWFMPAVLRLGRRFGGHLSDDPRAGRVGPVGVMETWLYEFAAIEMGAIVQNLALMTEALGLGGFPNCVAHPFVWFQALGFRMENVSGIRAFSGNRLLQGIAKLAGLDLPAPTAVGFERAGVPLLKPFCPPYYRSMEEAVLAFVDSKFNDRHGTLRSPAATGFRDAATVVQGIPRPSDQTIAATIRYCEHIYRTYGRFPSETGPFRTVTAFQVHRPDRGFYEQNYQSELLESAPARR